MRTTMKEQRMSNEYLYDTQAYLVILKKQKYETEKKLLDALENDTETVGTLLNDIFRIDKKIETAQSLQMYEMEHQA